MDEQKLTDWFQPDVLPARPGWYQREYKVKWLINVPDYFDGSHWFVGFPDWTHGANICGFARRWRGLAEPPLTDWFEDGVQPVREGVYEIDCAGDTDGRAFSHWDGVEWGYRRLEEYYGVDVQGAIYAASVAPRIRVPFKRRWRGLAVRP